MAEITTELMYEVLKAVRNDVAAMKTDLADVKATQLRMREDFHRFEGDLLRFERMQAATQLRLDRIETRLGLQDGPTLLT
jgi:hypothetical protein